MPAARLQRLGFCAALAIAVPAALACSAWPSLMADAPAGAETRVVMWFDDYDEVFSGSATRGAAVLGGGLLDLTNQHGDLRCVGDTKVRIVPPGARPPRRCDGMTGSAGLVCSDGREVLLDFAVEEGCGRGYGTGRDDRGNTLHAVFGGSQTRADTLAREAREHLAGSPRLPQGDAGAARASGGVSTGTAFFVSWEGHLVTNHHVILDHKKIQVQLSEGELAPARVIAVDAENDLALLQVDAIARPLALRAQQGLVKGEQVFALGYPLVAIQGQEQKATFGRVNALSGAQGDDRYVQVDVPIQPGNSGGPLIDRHGRVVGVITSMLHQQQVLQLAGVIPQNVNYALKAGFVGAALEKELGSDWTPAEPSGREHTFSQLVGDAQASVVLVVAW